MYSNKFTKSFSLKYLNAETLNIETSGAIFTLLTWSAHVYLTLNIISTRRLPITGVWPLNDEALPVDIGHLHGNVVIIPHQQGVVESPNLNHSHSEIVSVLSLPWVSKLDSLNKEVLSTHSYKFEVKEAPIHKFSK